MKKHLLLLIAVITTIGGSAQTFSYGGINYEIKNGVAYVAEGKYSGDITVQPMAYYGTTPYVVTGINEGAFKMLGTVTSVSLPTSIIDIREDAFYYCYSLNAINIPSQVRVIRKSTFTNCNLNSIFIPNSVDTIEQYAFAYCDRLTTVNIPASVKYIAENAFLDCSGITSYLVAADNDVYEGTADNKAIIRKSDKMLTAICQGCPIPDGVEKLIGSLYEYDDILTAITIPEPIKSIPGYCFTRCSSLESIVMPPSVTEIKTSAIISCKKLAKVTLSENLEHIGNQAFSGSDNITEIVYLTTKPAKINAEAFDENTYANAKLIVRKGMADTFRETEGWKQFGNIVEYEGPEFTINGITYSIDEDNNLFVKKVDGSLPSVNVPATVTYKGTRYKPQYLDEGAFMNCNAESVSLPAGIKKIGAFCFANCSNLKNVNIPVTVTSIGHGAFCQCKSLESISIPARTSEIGLSDPRNYGVFYFCDKLTTISVSKDNPYYESGDDDKYLMHKDTKTLVALCPDADIPQGTKILGAQFYTDSPGVSKAVVPNSVTEVRPYSFFRCRNLSELVLSRNLGSVDEYAFLDAEIGCVTLLNTKPEDIVVEKYDRIFGKARLVVPKGLKDAYGEIFPYDKNIEEYDYELADVNHDDSANTADVVKVYDVIINGVDSSDDVERVQPAADLNADCAINTADVVAIYEYIMNGRNY